MRPQSVDKVKPSEYDSRRVAQTVHKVLCGNTGFGTALVPTTTTPIISDKDNLDGVLCTVVTPAGANTEFNFVHNLQRIPTGFIVVYIDKAAIVYAGATAWTTEIIYLKCNAATVALIVFVF